MSFCSVVTQQLEKINRVQILAPIVGILVNLYEASSLQSSRSIIDALASIESSFTMEHFDFLLKKCDWVSFGWTSFIVRTLIGRFGSKPRFRMTRL